MYIIKPNSLAIKAPGLRAEYDPDNRELFESLTHKSNSKVGWICLKEKHKYTARVSDGTGHGSGCPECSGRRVSTVNSLATMAPHLRSEYSSKNKMPFDKICYGSQKKVLWDCALGHEWPASPHSRTSLNATGCRVCGRKQVSELNSLAAKAPHLRSQYSDKNETPFELVSFGSTKKVWWECSCGKEWEKSPNSRIANKRGCPRCSRRHTKLEKALERLLEVKKWNRPPIEGLLYRPDIKLSDKIYVNADGLYWHSVQMKSPDYHFRMREAFEGKGLRLLQFYEDEIYDKPNIVKSIVDKTLNPPSSVDGAVRSISEEQAREFLEQNHLAGSVAAHGHLGFYCGEALAGVMSVNIDGGVLKIVRFCGGGFRELLQHATQAYSPRRVEGSADLRYQEGSELTASGFKLQSVELDYEYTDNHVRKSKTDFEVDDEQVLAEQKWYRIYNAGRAKYVLDIP